MFKKTIVIEETLSQSVFYLHVLLSYLIQRIKTKTYLFAINKTYTYEKVINEGDQTRFSKLI